VKTTPTERIRELTDSGLWGDKTLCDYLHIHAQSLPNRLAAIDQPNRDAFASGEPLRLTFSELDSASDAMAVDFLDRGVGYKDRVMIQMPNVVELIICYFALSKLGAIASPLPVQYQSHEISTLSRVFGTQWFIGLDHFKGANLAENGLAAVPASQIITIGSDIVVRDLTGLSPQQSQQLAAHRAAHPLDANNIFTVCWTSGTTGTPKGVPRSHNMWFASGHMTASGSDYAPTDVLLNPFPMVNMSALGGFLFPATRLGCTIVLHHPIDVPVFLKQIELERVTFTIAPPALLNRLAQEPTLWQNFQFPALRAIGSGSAPLSPEMITTFEQDYKVKIYNIYGSNEGIALISSPTDVPDREQRAVMFPRNVSVDRFWGGGKAADYVRSKVIDVDSGQTLEQTGERGELCFDGPTVFDGYLGRGSEDVFTEDGYFRTGDLVEICGEKGEFYRIAGRIKDIINRGGMKISPAELDTVLEGYPGLIEVAVCAYPDADLGERICACMVVREGIEPPQLDDLRDFLEAKGVAKFKWPERLEVVEQLPRNPLGKVLRHALSELVATE